MRRIVVRALVSGAAACAASLLFTPRAGAQDQPLLDPGWQMAAPQSQYAGGATGNGGILQYLFGGGAGQPVAVALPPPPPPVYYRTVPAAPSRADRGASAYRAAAAASPVYYRTVPAPPLRGYQPAAGYDEAAAAPASIYEPLAPTYYQTMPPPPPGAYPPAPTYARAAEAPQPRGYDGTSMFSEAPSAPAFFASAPAPQPGADQPPAAPDRGFLSWPWHSAEAPSADQQPTPAARYDAGGPQPEYRQENQPAASQMALIDPVPRYAPSTLGDMTHPALDPKFDRQVVDYQTDQKPGTIVIDTPHFFLYLVLGDGKALRYGIGVGRPGFSWAGTKEISAMREWPDWYPPDDMLKRRPDLPRYMAGGPSNPLGARALYLGSTLYRIHGSNEPWTIGTRVSSGCIRLRNADVIDLYRRVKVGTKVVVL